MGVNEVHIVVVEDSPDDARMTLRAISEIDPPLSVQLARDGEEAVKLLMGDDRCTPKLIFLDLKMPKIHGFEVLRALREDVLCRDIPVVVLTSSSDPSDIERAKNLGANGFLCKPMDPAEYSRVVREATATYLHLMV